MTISIDELKKQGLNHLADLLEAKGDSNEENATHFSSVTRNESIDELFAGVNGLSEEFKSKAEVAFIAAVNEKADEVASERYTALEEKVAQYLDEQSAEQEQSIDNYLTFVADEWLKENQEAVESKLQTKLAESFMVGLRELFESHHISIPTNKVDMVEKLQTELAETRDILESALSKLTETREQLNLAEKSSIVDLACNGMTDVQTDKFHKLAHEFISETVESFKAKVNVIKEYFDKPVADKSIVVESKVDTPEDKSVVIIESADKPKGDAKMESYLAAIRKCAK